MPRRKSFFPPPPKAVARGGTSAGDDELLEQKRMTSAEIVGKLIQMRNEEKGIALDPAARGPMANVLAWLGVGRAPSNAGGQQPGPVVASEAENELGDSNRRQGNEPLFKGTLSGSYVSNKTIDNILGFPHPSSAGLYVFATHDGSGNTKMVGAHVVTLDVSAATMVSNHHRIAEGEVNLADVEAVISAYDGALKGGEGKEHTIMNVKEFLWRQALFAGTMSGQNVRLTSRSDLPGGDGVERVPVLVCAMQMLPYLGLNGILSSSLHMESSSWSSSTSMSDSGMNKAWYGYNGKQDEINWEKLEVDGNKISGGSSDSVGKSMQTPGVDLWDAAWHERNSGRSSLSTTACGRSSMASSSSMHIESQSTATKSSTATSSSSLQSTASYSSSSTTAGVSSSMASSSSLHITSQSTATKSSTATSSSLLQSTATYSSSSTTAGVSSVGVVVTAGSSSQSSAAGTSTTVTSTIMNTSSSNAVPCAVASILSQGDASSGRVAVSADDPRFMWIKDRVVNRTVDMKNESEIAGDATVYPEQQPQKYLEQKAFVKEFRQETHNHLTSLEQQVMQSEDYDRQAGSAYAFASNGYASNGRRILMVPKIVYEEVKVYEDVNPHNHALIAGDTNRHETYDQGAAPFEYSRQMVLNDPVPGVAAWHESNSGRSYSYSDYVELPSPSPSTQVLPSLLTPGVAAWHERNSGRSYSYSDYVKLPSPSPSTQVSPSPLTPGVAAWHERNSGRSYSYSDYVRPASMVTEKAASVFKTVFDRFSSSDMIPESKAAELDQQSSAELGSFSRIRMIQDHSVRTARHVYYDKVASTRVNPDALDFAAQAMVDDLESRLDDSTDDSTGVTVPTPAKLFPDDLGEVFHRQKNSLQEEQDIHDWVAETQKWPLERQKRVMLLQEKKMIKEQQSEQRHKLLETLSQPQPQMKEHKQLCDQEATSTGLKALRTLSTRLDIFDATADVDSDSVSEPDSSDASYLLHFDGKHSHGPQEIGFNADGRIRVTDQVLSDRDMKSLVASLQHHTVFPVVPECGLGAQV